MEFSEVVSNRHSYRGPYKDTKVSKEDLKAIMQAGVDAPSGCNMQTTSFIAVDDEQTLNKIRENMERSVGKTAPAMIIVLAQMLPCYHDRCFAVQDYSAAIQNMLLKIVDLGYESCWVEGYVTDESRLGEKIGEILGVPSGYDVVAMLPVGIADGEPRLVTKKAFEERAWFNGFGM